MPSWFASLVGIITLHLQLSSTVGFSVKDDPPVYDFIMLTREWPFSFCNIQSCSNTDLLQIKFNIHGLWAEIADNTATPGTPVIHCPNVTFNKSELVSLQAELQESWMNLKNPNGSAVKFWSEEFWKHGSCVATDPRYNSTYLYFKAALQLNAQYDLIQMLANAGIKPGPNLINSSDIRSALRDAFGFDGGVRCMKDNQTGSTLLYELRLCFTKDLQRMDCGEKPGPLPSQPAKQPQPPLQKSPEPEQEVLEISLFEWIGVSARQLRVLFGLELQIRDSPARRRSRKPRSPRARPHLHGRPRESEGTYACREGEMVLMLNSL